MTPQIGWWIGPLLFTVSTYAWALPVRADERPSGQMFSGAGYMIGVTIRLGIATSLSLASWLVWALMK